MVIKLSEEQYRWLSEARDVTNIHKINEIKHITKKKSQLKEDVYVNDIKGKKANLTYNKRETDSRTRNMGNLKSGDMLDTGKMDQNNNDTFIVPLKGGIVSYNITSIKGTEVMHYFKNKFINKRTTVKFDVNGVTNDYELFMNDSEFQNFMNTFIQKVNKVVDFAISNFNNENGFTGVSIYPVPSSSNFNKVMCEMIAGKVKISGLNTRKITTEIFKKDLSNLQKDTDFINKNKNYYSGRMYKGGDNDMSHEEYLDDIIRKYKNTTEAQDEDLINQYNVWVNRVITSYRQKVNPQTIAKNYLKLVDVEQSIRKKLKKSHWDNTFEQLKYAKGPSIEKRSEGIYNLITPILGKTYMTNHKIPIVQIQKKNFQIKNLTNDTRMGLKNYFKVQDDAEQEIKEIQNTIFVIFDDNVSGGATLSDICQQCKKIGINYLVPITFGEMRTKYTQGLLQVNKPTKNGQFENY